MLRTLIAVASLLAFIPSTASAEVFCAAGQYRISGYTYGMPALENIVLTNGVAMQSVSICGDSCTDPGTQARLAVALTAKALNKPLVLYFGTETSCSQVTAYSKPFAIDLD